MRCILNCSDRRPGRMISKLLLQTPDEAPDSCDRNDDCRYQAIITAANYRQDRLVPLLSHAHLPHARERDKSVEVAVTHQPKVCDPSAEGLLGPVSRTCTRNWLRSRDSNLNLAVNRSARPVQKSRLVIAQCRHVSPFSTWCRQRCCTRRRQRSCSGATPHAMSAIRSCRPNTRWSVPASIASLGAQLEGH